MPNLLIRDIEPDLLSQLKALAIQQAPARRLAETRRLSTRWVKKLRGRRHSDSTELIREDRLMYGFGVIDRR